MNSLNLFLEILTIISIISALCVITSTNPVIAIVFLIILFINVGIYLILMGLQFIGLSYLLVYVGAIIVLFLFIIMMLSVDIFSSVEVGLNYYKLLPLAYLITILSIILFLITIPAFSLDFTSGVLSTEIYSFINGFILSFKDKLYNINPTLFTPLLFDLNFLDSNFWVYHIVDNYNINNESFLILNNSAFGNPSTLLHKNLQINTLGESIYGYYSILLILSGFLLLLAMIAPIVLARKHNN